MRRSKLMLFISCGGLIAMCLFGALQAAEKNMETGPVEKLFKDGNFAEALEEATKLLRSKDQAPEALVKAYELAVNCYQRLNRLDELDAFREGIARQHEDQWQVVAAVAQSWLDRAHHGYLIAGEFQRGNHRGGGKVMNAAERDRVRALQLYWQAFQLLLEQADSNESKQLSNLLERFARGILHDNGYWNAWQMQMLTDLDQLPDYEEGWGYQHGQTRGAPVDEAGNPILYDVPASWEAAKNDGQRWRWALQEAARWNPQASTGDTCMVQWVTRVTH